ALMVLFTTVLLCLRRALRRMIVYRRFREGVETRNVLIVGAGRVGHALKNHIESLQHLGFRFKGFVALTEREAESGDADVIGDVRNCLSLARALVAGAPFMLAIAAAIRMDSEGKIFYKAQRIGRKGRAFPCYKFRTMVHNADQLKAELEHMNERDGVLFKIANDPRITKVGR